MRSESETILDQCKETSNLRISTMRQTARDHFTCYDAKKFLIGINGSYARREATARSDIDLFFITLDGDVCGAKKYQKDFFEILRKQNFILPSSGGIFDHPLDAEEITNIGGNKDTNINITRRILLLLEGEWIFNKKKFYDIRSEILKTYVPEDIAEDRICMFLLSDIIRYWRTVCVDFEHKIAEGKSKKHPPHKTSFFAYDALCFRHIGGKRHMETTRYPKARNAGISIQTYAHRKI